MSRLAFFLLLLVLCRLSTSATTSHDKNAKFQASSISTGIITTVAGYKILLEGDKSDGIPATSARLNGPAGLAIDKEGNFYIGGSEKVQKVSVSTGIITTVAGGGDADYSSDYGDGGPATSATLESCTGLALDTNGNIYIADQDHHRIRKVTASTGIITTVAGNGLKGNTESNVAALSTSLTYPIDVAVDASGNIYIADKGNGQIQKVTASTGIITTIAGNGEILPGILRRKSAKATEFGMYGPTGVALDSAGNVYIAGGLLDPCIFKVTVSTGNISVVVGSAFGVDNRFTTNVTIGVPMGVALDASGNIFISDMYGHLIRKVTASTGVMTTVAGTGKNATEPYQGEGGSATLAPILLPYGIDVDAVGNIYFCEPFLAVVKKVTYTEGSPSASVTPAPTVTRAPSTSTAPAPSASSPSVSKAPAVTPSASSPSSSSPSVTKAPAVTPSASSPPSSPSLSKTPAATPSASSPSVSKAPAVTPSASSPSSSSSSAPAATSTTGTQSSAVTHAAQTLHVTMILLSSLLILHLL